MNDTYEKAIEFFGFRPIDQSDEDLRKTGSEADFIDIFSLNDKEDHRKELLARYGDHLHLHI